MQVAAQLNDNTDTNWEIAQSRKPLDQIAVNPRSPELAIYTPLKKLKSITEDAASNASFPQDSQSQPRDQDFASFAKLPSELRHLIWRQAYLEHLKLQPCVCIYQGGTISDDPDINGTKSTGGSGQRYNHSIPQVHPESFPLELVSREAHSVCVAQYRTNQKTPSPNLTNSDKSEEEPESSQITLPSRLFNPEKDILYIDRRKRHGDGSTIVFYLGDRTRWVEHVRHIAIPFSIAIDIARHPSLLQHLKTLDKISLVFPPAPQDPRGSEDNIPTTQAPSPRKSGWATTLWSSLLLPSPTPARKARLYPLSQSDLNRLEIKDDPRRPSMLNGRPWCGGTASDFIELVKQSIGNRIRRTDQFSRELQAFYWRREDGDLRISLEGCVFG